MTRSLLISAALLALPTVASANINDAQSCQAVIAFASDRVGSVESYDKADVKTVQTGLNAYDAFLQSEHVAPGLKTFTKGDAAAMASYQDQIDAYKATVIKGLESRFSGGKIYMDQVMAINNCYTKMPMADADKPVMTKALETMMALSQS